jgi:hypothetical protein
MRINDLPPTDAELSRIFGEAPSVEEWELAIERHTKAYDRDDLQSDAYEHADALIAALDAGDLLEAGRLLNSARTKTAARRASFELIGKVGAS